MSTAATMISVYVQHLCSRHDRQMTTITDPEVYYTETTKEGHKAQNTDKLIHVTSSLPE